MHKYNFENATEKRAADKELGHILMPHPDGQEKHPEHQRSDTIAMLKGAVREHGREIDL